MKGSTAPPNSTPKSFALLLSSSFSDVDACPGTFALGAFNRSNTAGGRLMLCATGGGWWMDDAVVRFARGMESLKSKPIHSSKAAPTPVLGSDERALGLCFVLALAAAYLFSCCRPVYARAPTPFPLRVYAAKKVAPVYRCKFGTPAGGLPPFC